MKRILAPLDGSASSIHALEYLLDRKKRGERAEVFAINVQPDLPSSRFVSREAIEHWQAQEGEKALGSAPVRKLLDQLGADVYAENGDTAEVIVKFAKKTGCHEIVMGTRGLGRLKGLVMGSVATKIVQLATVPVTLVK
jgi:nucleotide-binding universal stress UspA family protein